jgi:hypothetical protein
MRNAACHAQLAGCGLCSRACDAARVYVPVRYICRLSQKCCVAVILDCRKPSYVQCVLLQALIPACKLCRRAFAAAKHWNCDSVTVNCGLYCTAHHIVT